MKLKTEATEKINETKRWSFGGKQINKIDKLLARLTKGKREKTQITKIRNEIGAVSVCPVANSSWFGSWGTQQKLLFIFLSKLNTQNAPLWLRDHHGRGGHVRL